MKIKIILFCFLLIYLSSDCYSLFVFNKFDKADNLIIYPMNYKMCVA